MVNNRVIAGIFLLALLAGCTREQRWEPEVVARVGDRTLTAGELTAWEASLPQTEITREMRSQFIRRWVEDELLYQAALDHNLLDDPWVAERTDELTRKLLVARLLELESGKIQPPGPGEIQSYFQEHSKEFTWPAEHIVVEYWHSSNRTAMNGLRRNLLRGIQNAIWQGAAGELDNGRIALDGPGSTAPAVWNVVSRTRVGQVTQVLNVKAEYWVFKVIDQRGAGEPQGLDDVRDEIIARLLEESRRKKREKLIRDMAEEYRRAGRLNWPLPALTAVDTAAGPAGGEQE